MKLIKSLTGKTIKFQLSGAVTHSVTPDGVVVADDHVDIMRERLGSQIEVFDADEETSAAKVEPEEPEDSQTESVKESEHGEGSEGLD